jgi:hypothetical protein
LFLLDVLDSVIITSLLLYVVLNLLRESARRVLLYAKSSILLFLLLLIRLDLIEVIVGILLGVYDIRGLLVEGAAVLAEGAATNSRFRRSV